MVQLLPEAEMEPEPDTSRFRVQCRLFFRLFFHFLPLPLSLQIQILCSPHLATTRQLFYNNILVTDHLNLTQNSILLYSSGVGWGSRFIYSEIYSKVKCSRSLLSRVGLFSSVSCCENSRLTPSMMTMLLLLTGLAMAYREALQFRRKRHVPMYDVMVYAPRHHNRYLRQAGPEIEAEVSQRGGMSTL